MANVEYVIGMKDNATGPVGKIGGALTKLEQKTNTLAATSEKSFSRVGISLATMAKATGVLLVAELAIDAVVGAFRSIGGGVADFDKATEAVRALDQAMELNGGSSNELMERYEALADSIERKTNIEAESVLGLMKSAAALGVENDQLDAVTRTAIGLSETLGISLEDGLKKARLATEGNFASFNKILPSMKDMATQGEKLAAVEELAAKGLAMKEAASHSASGEMTRASNAVGNLMEKVGAILSPIRELAARGITLLADAFSSILAPAIERIQELFVTWEPIILGAIEQVVNGVIAYFTFLEVFWGNFGSVVEMVFAKIHLYYETYRADTEHLFVNTLPAYIAWFGDNFFNIIETAFNAVVTVISNHIQKIADTFSVLWDFIASGGSTDILGQLGEIAGRSYLEGFESSIGELPNVAARSLTATEKELQNKIGSISGSLAEEFQKKFAERAVKFGSDSEGESLADKLSLTGSGDGSDASKKAGSGNAQLQAISGRLLARGPAEKREDSMAGSLASIAADAKATKEIQLAQQSELAQIKNALIDNPVIQFAGTP